MEKNNVDSQKTRAFRESVMLERSEASQSLPRTRYGGGEAMRKLLEISPFLGKLKTIDELAAKLSCWSVAKHLRVGGLHLFLVNSRRFAETYIDNFVNRCYVKGNIPTTPLPQGKRNMVGLFFRKIFTPLLNFFLFIYYIISHQIQCYIFPYFPGMMGVPAGRPIGMCWEAKP